MVPPVAPETEPVETILPPGIDTPEVAEDFSAFADDGDGAEAPPEPASGPGDAQAAVATPDSGAGVQPVVAPPVAPVAPAPPVVPQAQPIVPGAAAPVAPVPVAAPAAPAQPAMTDMQIRENLVTEIAGRYAMPEAVKDQFMLEPEKVLPTFAARLFVDVYDAVFNSIMAQIPQVMGQREQIRETQRSIENKFHERWPTLKDPSFQKDIAAVAKTYRAQNPEATFEQAIEAVGAMVSVIKGVPLPGQAAAQLPVPPQMRPPVPAGVGASRASAPVAAQTNLFADIFAGPDD